jgi:hypothetical protein
LLRISNLTEVPKKKHVNHPSTRILNYSEKPLWATRASTTLQPLENSAYRT